LNTLIETQKQDIEQLRQEIQKLRLGVNQGVRPLPDEEHASADAVQGRVVVKLPQDARLYVDDEACPLTSDTRSFPTPELEPGQAYVYELRVEMTTKDGKTVKQSKQIIVRAGKETVVKFDDPRKTQVAGR
jgi:uncharacterized protein (TIGR03000 family)